MSFPKYPAYENSGVEWLGELPTCWTAYDGRRLFGYVRDSASAQAEQLAATQAYGVVPQKWYMEQQGKNVVLALAGTENFKEVHVDDFVISLRSFQGGIEHSSYDGCVSPAYTVLRAIKPMLLLPNFYRYVFKERSYISALQSVTTGIREGRTITYEQFGSIALPVPTCSEQAQIARFLDYETAKIDALIEEQERLIELLKEKRQTVISHAVAKGLDPNVPMKDSGVEWLGEVPAHWAITKLGHYARVQTGFPFPSALFSLDDTDIRLLRGANVGVGALKWEDAVYWSRGALDQVSDYLMNEGQIVLGMDRPWISDGLRVARVLPDDMPCLLLQRVAAVTSEEALSHDYLFQLLSSEIFRAYVEPDLTGVSVPHISPEQILGFLIPVPPVHEQNQIVEFLKHEFGIMEALLRQASLGVALLQERRSALISAAVTGKIDVRGWHPPKLLSHEPHPEDKSCLERI